VFIVMVIVEIFFRVVTCVFQVLVRVFVGIVFGL